MTIHDQDLLAQADQANRPCDEAHACQVAAYAQLPDTGWTRGLTTEEWSWVLEAADRRDELAFQKGGR